MSDVEIERKLTLLSGILSLNTLSLIDTGCAYLSAGTAERNVEKRRTDWVGRLGDRRGSDWPSISSKSFNRASIIDELVRLGRQKGDGVQDEAFEKAAELVSKGG